MKYYEVRSKNIIVGKPSALTQDLMSVLKDHHVNYVDAKKALDYVNQVLLNYLLSKAEI